MNIPTKYLVAGVILFIVGLIGGAAIAFAVGGAMNGDAKEAADVVQLEEIWNEYEASVISGDFERWISLWDDDGIQMPPDEPRHIGKEQIGAANRPAFEDTSFEMNEFVINADEFRIGGDWAHSYGTGRWSMTPKEGGDTIEVAGKFSSTFKRQADGSWKIAYDSFNSNVPPT